MAWFGEADHAANPPPYLTLWWIPVSNTYESMPNPVHMDTTYWWHILVPHTEYTHKYNHAGIKTWGKWLQKQLISATQRAWHRTMVSEPSTYHDLLHPLHWALHVTQAQTSYMNASMHVWFLPHKIMVIRCHMTLAANQMPHCDPNYHEHLRINAYMHINIREWRRVPTNTCNFFCSFVIHASKIQKFSANKEKTDESKSRRSAFKT